MNIVLYEQHKNMNILNMNICQVLNKTSKKLLDGCSSILEVILVKHLYTFFWSTFDTLTKNALKIFKLEKIFKIIFFSCSKNDLFDKKQL